MIAEEASQEKHCDYKDRSCTNYFLVNSCLETQHIRSKTGDLPATPIPIIVVVLLCFGVAWRVPFALVPVPVSTFPPLEPVFAMVLPPASEPGSLAPEVEGALSGAAVKDVKSVLGRVVDGCA